MTSPGTPDTDQLLRFARLLSPSDEAAEAVLAAVLRKDLPSTTAPSSRESRLELIRAIWQMQADQPAASAGLPQFLTGLTPAQRVAAALHHTEAATPGEIEDICGLTPADTRDLLARCPTDEEARTALGRITATPEAMARMTALAERLLRNAGPSSFLLWSPVGFAVLLALGVLLWAVLGRRGIENPALGQELLDRAAHLESSTLEPVHVPVGELSDWLFLKHNLENVHIPPAFAAFPAAWCGVTRISEHPIAEIALEKPRALLFLFQASDFELSDTPPGQWQIYSQDEWSGAFQVERGEARVIAMRAPEADLEAFLNGLKR